MDLTAHMLLAAHTVKTDNLYLARHYIPLPGVCTGSMSKSPAHVNLETIEYACYEFDPQANFSQDQEQQLGFCGMCFLQMEVSANMSLDKLNLSGLALSLLTPFDQFLEEARQHTRDLNLQRSSSCSEEVGKKRLGGQKKSKKSWKNSLFFSWWKIDRKSRTSLNPVDSPNISKPTKGFASGPVCGSGTARGGVDTPCRRPSSGPVSIIFNPTRKVENEVPYMCLGQPNDPYQINAYGPVYLVT
ncbi:hypothetical protein PTKIN_Ptkin18bG0085200 [Pterospermum kingtungense]